MYYNVLQKQYLTLHAVGVISFGGCREKCCTSVGQDKRKSTNEGRILQIDGIHVWFLRRGQLLHNFTHITNKKIVAKLRIVCTVMGTAREACWSSEKGILLKSMQKSLLTVPSHRYRKIWFSSVDTISSSRNKATHPMNLPRTAISWTWWIGRVNYLTIIYLILIILCMNYKLERDGWNGFFKKKLVTFTSKLMVIWVDLFV